MVRPAFSLAELVVAIGLLVLMLTLAGQVMTLTVKSTGQANSLTEVNQLLRAFEETIRDDLRNVRPGQSLLLIQSNPINAYWTQNQSGAASTAASATPATKPPAWKSADYADAFVPANMEKPRADILMFFTSREESSYVDPKVTGQLQQVVYGHAELGEYVPDSANPMGYKFVPTVPAATLFPPNSTTLSNRMPAEFWHLARRSALLLPIDSPVEYTPSLPKPTETWEHSVYDPYEPDRFRLDTPRLLEGAMDIVANFDFDRQVLTADTRDVSGGYPLYLPRIFDPVSAGSSEWGHPFQRSRLDVSPPPKLANQLGHYFIPNCASFKVEWTLDPRSAFVGGRLDGEKELYWFDQGAEKAPAAARNSFPTTLGALVKARDAEGRRDDASARFQRLDELLNFRSGTAGFSLAERFQGGGDPDYRLPSEQYGERNQPGINLAIFNSTRQLWDGTSLTALPESVYPAVFPAALRITIDVFDKARRLDRPIRHVIVVPVGG